jgi:hypothetical protein
MVEWSCKSCPPKTIPMPVGEMAKGGKFLTSSETGLAACRLLYLVLLPDDGRTARTGAGTVEVSEMASPPAYSTSICSWNCPLFGRPTGGRGGDDYASASAG